METLPARSHQPSEIPLESEFPRAGPATRHLFTALLVTPDPNTPALPAPFWAMLGGQPWALPLGPGSVGEKEWDITTGQGDPCPGHGG